MKKTKTIALILIVFLNPITATGCWNYRETDKLAIVAGVAIDKGIDKKLSMTVELVEFSSSKDTQITSKTMTIEGNTIFDAARNNIGFSGQKLYWSHAKAVLISEEVARKGIIGILDWFNRDSETRGDVNLIITRGHTAKETFSVHQKTNPIRAFEMKEIINNEKSLSKAPNIQLWEIVSDIAGKGVTAVAPVIDFKMINGAQTTYIGGTAAFKKDKLVGFLNEEETKDMLFVRDKIRGGVLVQIGDEKQEVDPVSLEIFQSKTKIEPVYENGFIKFNVSINTVVSIDEIGGTANYIDDKGREKLEQSVAKTMERRIERTIKKMQHEYSADVFGFGAKLREDNPKVWKSVEDKWDKEFQNAKVDVKMMVHIRNSSMLSKPMEVSE